MTQVIQQPDETIVLGMDEHNPYVYAACSQASPDVESQNNVSTPVYFGQHMMWIPNTYVERAADLENYRVAMTYITSFESMTAIFMFILTGNLGFLITTIFGVVGYIGVRYYDRKFLFLYALTQIFSGCSKIAYSVVVGDVVPGLFSVINFLVAYQVGRMVGMIPITTDL
jgi:hypothetical protein